MQNSDLSRREPRKLGEVILDLIQQGEILPTYKTIEYGRS